MKVLAISVGRPRTVQSGEKTVLTSIFKKRVSGRVPVRGDNLAGDQQSDLTVHGGHFKAVYAYPSEHYAFWKAQLPGVDLPWGSFGENLTIEGLVEDDIHVGDRLRIGSAELVVTQPRMPCFKLGIRFDDPQMVKRFLDSRRSGFYMSVVMEGDIGPGDAIDVLQRHEAAVSIREILRMRIGEDKDPDRLRATASIEALSPGWRKDIEDKILGGGPQ